MPIALNHGLLEPMCSRFVASWTLPAIINLNIYISLNTRQKKQKWMSCLTRVHSQTNKQCWRAQFFWTNITDEVFFHTSKVLHSPSCDFSFFRRVRPLNGIRKVIKISSSSLLYRFFLFLFFLCDLHSVRVPASKLLNTIFFFFPFFLVTRSLRRPKAKTKITFKI